MTLLSSKISFQFLLIGFNNHMIFTWSDLQLRSDLHSRKNNLLSSAIKKRGCHHVLQSAAPLFSSTTKIAIKSQNRWAWLTFWRWYCLFSCYCDIFRSSFWQRPSKTLQILWPPVRTGGMWSLTHSRRVRPARCWREWFRNIEQSGVTVVLFLPEDVWKFWLLFFFYFKMLDNCRIFMRSCKQYAVFSAKF